MRTMKFAGLALAASAFLAGCRHEDHGRGYPPDPLLLSKTPVQVRPSAPSSSHVSLRLPDTPEMLALAPPTESSP